MKPFLIHADQGLSEGVWFPIFKDQERSHVIAQRQCLHIKGLTEGWQLEWKGRQLAWGAAVPEDFQ